MSTESDRIKVGYTMDREFEQILRQMSKDDLRTCSAQLEYLIRQEHERRQNSRTLVDQEYQSRLHGKPARPGTCPSCSRVATFDFVGMQDDERGPQIELWTCGACGSTLSGRRVWPVASPDTAEG